MIDEKAYTPLLLVTSNYASTCLVGDVENVIPIVTELRKRILFPLSLFFFFSFFCSCSSSYCLSILYIQLLLPLLDKKRKRSIFNRFTSYALLELEEQEEEEESNTNFEISRYDDVYKLLFFLKSFIFIFFVFFNSICNVCHISGFSNSQAEFTVTNYIIIA